MLGNGFNNATLLLLLLLLLLLVVVVVPSNTDIGLPPSLLLLYSFCGGCCPLKRRTGYNVKVFLPDNVVVGFWPDALGRLLVACTGFGSVQPVTTTCEILR